MLDFDARRVWCRIQDAERIASEMVSRVGLCEHTQVGRPAVLVAAPVKHISGQTFCIETPLGNAVVAPRLAALALVFPARYCNQRAAHDQPQADR